MPLLHRIGGILLLSRIRVRRCLRINLGICFWAVMRLELVCYPRGQSADITGVNKSSYTWLVVMFSGVLMTHVTIRGDSDMDKNVISLFSVTELNLIDKRS